MQPGCEQAPLGIRRASASRRPRIPARRVTTSGAFTLIELLVIIGIISVLISILLPALGKVREQARTVVCASNQRQILHSIMLYTADNKGWLPRPLSSATIGRAFYKQYSYCAILMDDVSHYDYVTPGALLRYISHDAQIRQRIFSCPSDGPERYAPSGMGVSGGPPGPNFNKPRNFSYNFNTYGGAMIDNVLTHMIGTFDGFDDPSLLKVCADPILAVQEPNHSHTHGRWIDRIGEHLAAFDADDFLSRCRELGNSSRNILPGRRF